LNLFYLTFVNSVNKKEISGLDAYSEKNNIIF